MLKCKSKIVGFKMSLESVFDLIRRTQKRSYASFRIVHMQVMMCSLRGVVCLDTCWSGTTSGLDVTQPTS